MVKVIKKNRKIVAFSAAKIKKGVLNAAKDAKLPKSVRNMLVRKVAMPVIRAAKKKKVVRTSEIKKSILSKLGRRSVAAFKSWKKYERR